MVDKSKFKPYISTRQGSIYWYDGCGDTFYVCYDYIGKAGFGNSADVSHLVPLDEWKRPVDDGVYFGTDDNFGVRAAIFVKGGKRYNPYGEANAYVEECTLGTRIGDLPDEFKVAD